MVPHGAAGALGHVIKSKYHYLFVQHRDSETGVTGTAVFRFERLEAAHSVLNQIVVQQAMVKRGSIYVRRKSEKQNSPLPNVGERNTKQE